LQTWLQQTGQADHHFHHPEKDSLHIALASLLYHIMFADGRTSNKEMKEFSDILIQEFEINDEQVDLLFEYVKASNTHLENDLETINTYLEVNPHLRMNFMQKLMHLVSIDGINEKELKIFNNAMSKFFPEIKI